MSDACGSNNLSGERKLSKAKVRSMQRGAQKRPSASALRMRDIYDKHPPQMASADKPHLDFLKYGRLERINQITTVIDAAKKNGIGTAAEISHLLNKLLIKTAIGEKWTPRLAWFVAMAIKSQRDGSRVNFSSGTVRAHSDVETNFRDKVDVVVNSRLEEIRSEFEESRPKLGDALPELVQLKKRLEKDLG